MAKFLNTTGVSYHLEELIKSTKDKLILISPYLQFTERIKEHMSNLNIQKKDIRIVYRENKLQPEEHNWLEKQIGIRTSICKNLHAKCYINENEAIITSMNLYEFSQMNNNEMGIYFTKADDPDLYNSTLEEVQRLLTISDEIRVSVTKINKVSADKNQTSENELLPKKGHSKIALKTTKELAEMTGLSSRDINTLLSDNKLMYKKDEDWIATKRGIEIGAVSKIGTYGKFIVWPENILDSIKK